MIFELTKRCSHQFWKGGRVDGGRCMPTVDGEERGVAAKRRKINITLVSSREQGHRGQKVKARIGRTASFKMQIQLKTCSLMTLWYYMVYLIMYYMLHGTTFIMVL